MVWLALAIFIVHFVKKVYRIFFVGDFKKDMLHQIGSIESKYVMDSKGNQSTKSIENYPKIRIIRSRVLGLIGTVRMIKLKPVPGKEISNEKILASLRTYFPRYDWGYSGFDKRGFQTFTAMVKL